MAVVNNIRELRKSRGTIPKDIAVKTGFSAGLSGLSSAVSMTRLRNSCCG